MASRLLLLESYQHAWRVAGGTLTLRRRQVGAALRRGWGEDHGRLVRHHEPGGEDSGRVWMQGRRTYPICHVDGGAWIT